MKELATYKEQLARTFLEVKEIDPAILEELLDAFEYVEFDKKEIMLRPGETARYLYYVLEGAQKSYLVRDKVHVMAFSYPPFFCAIPDSFLLQIPSLFFLESITESKMLRISYERLQALLEKNIQLESLLRKQHEMMIVGLHTRQMELMAMSMEEKFEAFYKRSFHLFQMVSHKDIASYLNIDPTNLSKLLKKQMK
ncbi:MAG: cyclic nucleotide-binding domain-containing protein [Bacteroidota bacterium]